MAPSYIQPTNTVQQKALAVAHGEFRVNLAVVLYPFYGFNPCRKGRTTPLNILQFWRKNKSENNHARVPPGSMPWHAGLPRSMHAGRHHAGLHSRGYHASAQTAMRGLQLGAAMWGRHVGPPFAGPPFGRGASMFAGPSCSRFVWVFCGRHKQFLELTYRPPHTNCGLWDRPSP